MENSPFDSFICADTEDNSRELLEAGKSGFDKQLTQIAAVNREGKKWYGQGPNCGKEFLKWLARQPEQHIYFHNTQYDLGALFGKELDRLDVTLVGGRFIKAVWPQGPGKPPKFFLDNFNLWPMSIARIAPAFGLEKLAFNATDRDYVFRDTEILREAVNFCWDFAHNAGLRGCPNTLGSFGVKLWEKWGGEHPNETLGIAKEATYGGRVELFKVHNDCRVVCHTDINSLYPFVMCKEYPDYLEKRKRSKTPPKFGVMSCDIQVPECEIAPLPFRRDDGRIFFPWGKFKGVWTIPEIENALRHGAKILKVHEVWGTEDFTYPYKDFMTRLYRARNATKSAAEREFFKRLMATLYGRTGSTGTVTRSVWQTQKNKWDGVPYGDKVLVDFQLPLGPEVNWTHCAYLTAYGRLELQKYQRIIGAEKLIYSDTDSVIFDLPDVLLCGDLGHMALPPWYFPTGRELGDMKLEYLGTDAVHCWAPKSYRRGKKWKAKGVPKKMAEKFLTTGHASYDLPFRFREACAFYDRNNAKMLGVWRTVDKYMRSQYDRKTLKANRFYPCKINCVE